MDHDTAPDGAVRTDAAGLGGAGDLELASRRRRRSQIEPERGGRGATAPARKNCLREISTVMGRAIPTMLNRTCQRREHFARLPSMKKAFALGALSLAIACGRKEEPSRNPEAPSCTFSSTSDTVSPAVSPCASTTSKWDGSRRWTSPKREYGRHFRSSRESPRSSRASRRSPSSPANRERTSSRTSSTRKPRSSRRAGRSTAPTPHRARAAAGERRGESDTLAHRILRVVAGREERPVGDRARDRRR